jgi:protein TonB
VTANDIRLPFALSLVGHAVLLALLALLVTRPPPVPFAAADQRDRRELRAKPAAGGTTAGPGAAYAIPAVTAGAGAAAPRTTAGRSGRAAAAVTAAADGRTADRRTGTAAGRRAQATAGAGANAPTVTANTGAAASRATTVAAVEPPPPLSPPPAPTAEPPIVEPTPPPKRAMRRLQPVLSHPERPEQAKPSPPVPLSPTPQSAPPAQTAYARVPAPAPAASEVSASYRTLLGAWLERHKHYPEQARERGEEGRAVLKFTVDRSGRVLDFAVIRSSGYPDLDTAVESMMRGASLPPFPADMRRSSIEVSVAIRFSLEH